MGDHSSGYGLFSSASNNGLRRRKIDSDNNSGGYGIISAASNAYKVIKMTPDVIKTVQSDFGWDDEYDYDDYGEYTLEEAFFNQLEEERREKKREKRKKKKRKN